jgi:ABC-type transport system involved in multi-copper enzyme maturation permease subunit
MLQLIKKDFSLFVLFSVPPQVLLSLAWLLLLDELNVAVVLVQVLFVLITATALTSHAEQVEENNQGYRFLQNLPISALEIVAAKFFLIFSTLVFLVISNTLLFGLLARGRGGLRLPVAFLLMAGCVALVLSALVFLGIAVLGGDLFFSVSSALVVVMVVLYVLVFEKSKVDVSRIIEDAVGFLKSANLTVHALISLGLFLLLMGAAVLALKTGRIRLLRRFKR